MRTTIALDDNLVDAARKLTGLNERSSLMREALKALIESRAIAASGEKIRFSLECALQRL